MNKSGQPARIDALSHIRDEVRQRHETRKHIYEKIESDCLKDCKVVSFFTTFYYPSLIEDNDATMLEEVLTNTALDNKKLIVILNSPGGDALAAERIINICRSYGNGRFSVVVPKMAKSAATMICLGADEIFMSKTSELGPIDPQILIRDDNGIPIKYQAAHEIIESYEDLVSKANKSKGNLDPYLQQLSRYDARDIRSIVSAQQLSESIAVKSLKSGMLKGMTEGTIKKQISTFLDPRQSISHGRPIYHDLAKKSGLNINLQENNSDFWQAIWQIYVRLNYVVNSMAAKVIESATDSWSVNPPAGGN